MAGAQLDHRLGGGLWLIEVWPVVIVHNEEPIRRVHHEKGRAANHPAWFLCVGVLRGLGFDVARHVFAAPGSGHALRENLGVQKARFAQQQRERNHRLAVGGFGFDALGVELAPDLPGEGSRSNRRDHAHESHAKSGQHPQAHSRTGEHHDHSRDARPLGAKPEPQSEDHGVSGDSSVAGGAETANDPNASRPCPITAGSF